MRHFTGSIIYGFIYFSSIYFCGCRTSSSYFEYDKKNFFVFDEKGSAVHHNGMAPKPQEKQHVKRVSTDDGCTGIYAGNKLLYKGDPGDFIAPLAEEENFIYLLTEKSSNWQNVVKLCKKTGKYICLSNNEKECINIIYHKKLHGLVYAKDTFQSTLFTPEYRKIQKKISRDFQTENILWRECSSDGTKWIIQLFFPDKPDIFLCADIDKGDYKILSEKLQKTLFCTRKIYSYKVDDGTRISGILTFPADFSDKKKYPLIVFPHGGPQSRSMLSFDPRTEFLSEKGFIVFQPNYRGSTGQGKSFRKQGWKAEGIRKSLHDIAEGTYSLIRKKYVDKEKIYLFGGSWGAYCTLTLAALYPELYKKAVAFFPPSDLPEMLLENLPESGGEKGWDILQYGDINNVGEMEKLRNISPYFLADKIIAPVLLYHYENDRVIGYAQSVKFVEKMKKLGKKICFVKGKGSHGFSTPSDEEKAYFHIVDFFREGIKDEK